MTTPDGRDDNREPGLTTRDKIVLVGTFVVSLAALFLIVTYWDSLIATVRR
jgi:hypothetical protein